MNVCVDLLLDPAAKVTTTRYDIISDVGIKMTVIQIGHNSDKQIIAINVET